MLGFPKKSELRKPLHKKAIFERLKLNTAQQDRVDADISRLYFVNEISPFSVGIAEGETIIPKTLFVGLHCIGKGAGSRNCIHAQFIQLIIPAEDLFKVIIEYAAAEKTQSLKLGTFDLMTVHIDRTGTLDGTGEAALIDYIMLLGQGFAVDLFKVIIAAVGIVFGGEETAHLHAAHKSCSAETGQLVAGEGMVAEIFEPFFAPCGGLFLVVNGDFMVAADSYCLQILPAQNRTHTGASARALFAHNSGIENKVFTCGAYAKAAKMSLFVLSAGENIRKGILSFRGFHSPKGVCVMEDKLIIVYLQPGMLGAFSLYDQSIHARFFQIVTKAAAAVGACDYSRLGREG